MLVDYTTGKGDKLQGALFLPADYQKGRSYPTIVYIYERLSDGSTATTLRAPTGSTRAYIRATATPFSCPTSPTK
jgi:hypothetical protein